VFLASSDSSQGCKLTVLSDNIFAAVLSYLQGSEYKSKPKGKQVIKCVSSSAKLCRERPSAESVCGWYYIKLLLFMSFFRLYLFLLRRSVAILSKRVFQCSCFIYIKQVFAVFKSYFNSSFIIL